MKSIRGVSVLSVFMILAVALLAPACHSVDVAPWPYTTQPDNTAPSDAGASDGGASDGGALDDKSNQGAAGLSGIQANYGPQPLSCDGGLCNTDNYSLCNIAGSPVESRAVWPLSVLFAISGVAFARKRSGRKARRSS